MKILSSTALLFLFSAIPAFATVTVSSPTNGATVASPVQYVASATTNTCSAGVSSMGIYVNNKLAYFAKGAQQINTSLSLSAGAQRTVVQEWDKCGGSSSTAINITVGSSSQTSGVVVTSPANNSTVTSPVQYVASATTNTCSAGVSSMGIYVNNKLAYFAKGAQQINTSLSLSAGAQRTVVQEWDKCGGSLSTAVNITVGSSSQTNGVVVTSPANNSTVTSPVQYVASATTNTCSAGVSSMGIYVDNKLAYFAKGAQQINTSLSLSAGAQRTVVQEWDKCGGALSTTVNLTVQQATAGSGVNITTWHVDNNRSGLNSEEQSLTPWNVNSQTFGKLFSYLVDGYVYGEPLLVSNLTINGGTHNVLFVATEKDSVYAFDADSYGTGAPLWKVSLLQSGETPITESSTNLADGVIRPYKGITSTPVIDLTTNTMYIVSTQVKSGTAASFRLNAVDITTGAQKFGGPVTIHASVPGTNTAATNGMITLTASCLQRSALLLANNTVYMGFGGCVTGWLLGYDAQTLAQTAVFNASPNLNGEGTYASAGGIWMGGGGPVADSSGNIYVVTGNGPWDGKTAWGDSVLKFNAQLQMQDYFTPDAYQYMDCRDADMASGGLLLVPGTTEILAGGKTGRLFLLNTSNLGHEQVNDLGATQRLWFESDLIAPYSYSCTDSSGINRAEISPYENFGTAAYFNGSIYLGVTPNGQGVIPAGVRQFTYSSNSLTPGTYPGAYTAPSIQLHSYGTTPFISANGATNGIMWMIDHGSPLQNPAGSAPTTATLRAYDANDLSKQLYNSGTNPGDAPGYGIKFTSPVVANGKVYISTGKDLITASNPRGEIDVYGLK